MADINAIADQIQGLTLLEASQLVKMLEEKLGVSAAAAAPMMMAGGGGAAAAAPAVEEKTMLTGGVSPVRVYSWAFDSATRFPIGDCASQILELQLQSGQDCGEGLSARLYARNSQTGLVRPHACSSYSHR